MDAVITYVNGLDPLWQKDFEKYAGRRDFEKRFRDWGTLPYLLRGIETCMPFIKNVFLVVARESQVPEWVDGSNLHVVLHKDIVPERFLPLFNSASIEMFLHRIEGLDEEFVYFNDDFFPLMDCNPEDFFVEGKACGRMAKHLFTFGNLYRRQTRNSDRLSRKAAGKGCSAFFVRPQHTCAPMLRSLCQELYERCEEQILSSVSPLREKFNFNQYIYTDYAFFKDAFCNRKISNKHLSLAVSSASKVSSFIDNPDSRIACINDVQMSEDNFISCRDSVLKAFQKRFPEKSRFER